MNRKAAQRAANAQTIGKKFGRLTILGIRLSGRHTLAKCRCDCGCTKEIRLSHICGTGKSGKTKSCGCLLKSSKLPLEKLVGKTFGFLTVLSGRSNGQNLLLRCECHCGSVKEIPASSIKGIGKRGGTISCGCKRGHHNKARRLHDSHDLFVARLKEYGWKLIAFSICASPNNKSIVQCPNGHNAEYTPSGFSTSARYLGSPACVRCNICRMLQEAAALAGEHAGKCLTTEDALADVSKFKKFTGANQKLDWLCLEGHPPFKSTLADVRGGHWCAPCTQAIFERKCRAAFEQLFEDRFPASIPNFLKVGGESFRIGSVTLRMGRGALRLDGYCEKLRLAFEHNGHQHYFKTRTFGNEVGFGRAVLRDIVKRRLCRENGITLITIPMLGFYRLSDESRLKDFIQLQCERQEFPLPDGFRKTTVDLSVAYKTSYAREQLALFRERLKSTGRTLIEVRWLGGTQKHRIICACGCASTAVPFDWGKFSCGHCVREKKIAGYQRSHRVSHPIDELIRNLERAIAAGETKLPDRTRQKILKARKKQSDSMVKLLPHQFAKLQALGVFDVRSFDDRFQIGTFRKRDENARWMQRLDEIKSFARNNGHTQPRVKSMLEKWVNEQRRRFKEKRLAAWRQTALESVSDWTWHNQRETSLLKVTRLTETRNEQTINKWRPHLLVYQRCFGALTVPRDYVTPDGLKLGGFVSSMRSRYSRGQLSPKIVEFLDSIPGWLWDTGRYKNKGARLHR